MTDQAWPKISIVTPSYNQGLFLERTIASVLGQNYPSLEYMVIDGDSTDSSIETIKKYQDDLEYWVSEPDRGQTHAINKGLAHSSGEIMNWLNSDDVLRPDALRTIAEAFRRYPEADFVYGDCDLIDATGKHLIRQYSPEFNGGVMVYGRSIASQPACFWRRSAWEDLGPLDESYNFCMDMEYWIRAVMAGCQFRLVHHPLAATRIHEGTKTSSIREQLALEHREILNRYGLLPFPNRDVVNSLIYRLSVLAYKAVGLWCRLKSRRQFMPLRTTRLLGDYRT
jgi:carbamoyltransferase